MCGKFLSKMSAQAVSIDFRKGKCTCETNGFRFVDLTEAVRKEARKLGEGVLSLGGAAPKTLQEAERGVEQDIAEMLQRTPGERERYAKLLIMPVTGGELQLGTYQRVIAFGRSDELHLHATPGNYFTCIQLKTLQSIIAQNTRTPQSCIDIR